MEIHVKIIFFRILRYINYLQTVLHDNTDIHLIWYQIAGKGTFYIVWKVRLEQCKHMKIQNIINLMLI